MNRHPIHGHAPDCRDPQCGNTPWACDGPQSDCTCGAIYVDPGCVEHAHLVAGPTDDPELVAAAGRDAA